MSENLWTVYIFIDVHYAEILISIWSDINDMWSYNIIFTVLISKYFPECPIDNATSCYMNQWQSTNNGC